MIVNLNVTFLCEAIGHTLKVFVWNLIKILFSEKFTIDKGINIYNIVNFYIEITKWQEFYIQSSPCNFWLFLIDSQKLKN